MRAVVIYESMFGDNQQVARAIAAGLAEGGVAAEAIEVGVAPTEIGQEVDLLVVGSPNHAWSMPRPSTRQSAAEQAEGPLVSRGIGVREWLGSARLPRDLRTVAYDTRGSHPKAVVAMDHASTSIEKGLAKLGGSRLVPAEHFRVADMQGPLEPGEPERAHAWGVTLAGLLLAPA
jgi:hypothetical protein